MSCIGNFEENMDLSRIYLVVCFRVDVVSVRNSPLIYRSFLDINLCQVQDDVFSPLWLHNYIMPPKPFSNFPIQALKLFLNKNKSLHLLVQSEFCSHSWRIFVHLLCHEKKLKCRKLCFFLARTTNSSRMWAKFWPEKQLKWPVIYFITLRFSCRNWKPYKFIYLTFELTNQLALHDYHHNEVICFAKQFSIFLPFKMS